MPPWSFTLWLDPANPVEGWGFIGRGLTLNCLNIDKRIEQLPTALTTMVMGIAVNGEELSHKFFASEGVWVGARFALFAKNRKGNSEGYAVFTSFNR